MIGLLIAAAILFFVLAPGVLLTLPPGSAIYTSAAVHAVVFAVVLYVVMRFLLGMA
jgi:hypothetical protein